MRAAGGGKRNNEISSIDLPRRDRRRRGVAGAVRVPNSQPIGSFCSSDVKRRLAGELNAGATARAAKGVLEWVRARSRYTNALRNIEHKKKERRCGLVRHNIVQSRGPLVRRVDS